MLFKLGDHSDYSILFKQSGKNGKWFWNIRDETGKIRLLPPVFGRKAGFDEYEGALADAREVVDGLGADFGDIEVQQ